MRKLLTTTLAFILLLVPSVTFAQILYKNPMVNIPGYAATGDFNDFVNLVYGLSISVAALLAVLKIVIAGVKWMLSDVVTSKTDAKADIQSALFGLIVIISAVLVISLINPEIVN